SGVPPGTCLQYAEIGCGARVQTACGGCGHEALRRSGARLTVALPGTPGRARVRLAAASLRCAAKRRIFASPRQVAPVAKHGGGVPRRDVDESRPPFGLGA